MSRGGGGGALVVSCTATSTHLYRRSKELYLKVNVLEGPTDDGKLTEDDKIELGDDTKECDSTERDHLWEEDQAGYEECYAIPNQGWS